MDDSISRRAMQEIVDRIGGMYPYRQIGNRESYSSYNEAWTDCINRVDAELNSLPSAQPEPCENTVSRKDAIRWVKTECNPYGKPTLDFDSGKKVIEHLKHMSPVTPKRKTGKWIMHPEVRNCYGGTYIECSECGEKYMVQHVEDEKFCRNCGADMRGKQDGQFNKQTGGD